MWNGARGSPFKSIRTGLIDRHAHSWSIKYDTQPGTKLESSSIPTFSAWEVI